MVEGDDTAEAQLLAAARQGDEAAFEGLVQRHRRELYAHCYRMLGSVHDAEDALQESLLGAWRGLRGFEGRSSLRTWLYRVATNACLRLSSRGPAACSRWTTARPGTTPPISANPCPVRSGWSRARRDARR